MTQPDPKPSATAISIKDISKRYGRVLALDNVFLTVERGSLSALLGPNGAGKSTLIDILCTIQRPDTGVAEVSGINVVQNPRATRRELGVVFQESTLDTRLTVKENLEFHGMVYHMTGADIRRRVAEMLDLVELSDWRDATVATLSTGMRRRLEIARALMHSPKVLFLDEPTVGLDTQSRSKIWHYLGKLRQSSDLTIVVTTHYIEEVEDADYACIIDHGKILAEGTPDSLKSEFGRSLLRVRTRTPTAHAALMERFPGTVEGADGHLLIDLHQAGSADALLAEFGTQLRDVTVDQPSLESVFLALTGRDLRDAPPSRTKRGPRK